MNTWTPEAIAGLITAATALVTAVGAVVHSRNTRSALADHTQAVADRADSQGTSSPPQQP